MEADQLFIPGGRALSGITRVFLTGSPVNLYGSGRSEWVGVGGDRAAPLDRPVIIVCNKWTTNHAGWLEWSAKLMQDENCGV